MKFWRWSAIFFLGTWVSVAMAQEPVSSANVETHFVGDITLEQLSRGENGSGILLYYLSQNGPQRPSLAARLSKQPGTDVAVAEVFTAPLGEDYIPIHIDGDRVTIRPSLPPALTIKALGGWWVKAGLVNYNLDIQVNGPVFSMWGAGEDSKFGSGGWRELVKFGEPAVSITVRDPNHDGTPMWDLRMLLPAFPERGFYRTNYAERRCKTPLKHDLGVSPLWPYVAKSGGYEQPTGRLHPPIVVDWEQGKVTHFSELVTVRNQNCSYSLYSINGLVPGEVNQANFETPFAFYDLSGQGKGYPNLILRTERFPIGDPWSIGLDSKVQQGRPVPRDFETVRYSWRNAVGDGQWDYKVEVLGFEPYNFKTAIADGAFQIDAPSYESFPRWVTEKDWPVVTFVDTEGTTYNSSEGIYEWSPREVGIGYVFGWHDKTKTEAFRTSRTSLRGEYRFTQNIAPHLYLSPIDNRLHLLGAEGGLWGLDETSVLRVHNLDGGSYINGWTRERVATETSDTSASQYNGATTEEALYALDGYLLYSGPQGSELRQAAYQPSNFEILPPTDKATWQSFREQLALYMNQKRDPKNLRSWLNHFPGKALTIAGGRVSNVRFMPDGFRFMLDLPSDFRLQGEEFFAWDGLQPGSYVVTYDGAFTIRPLTPPAFSASLPDATFTQFETNAVAIALQNDGLQDLPEATLELWATPTQGQETVVATQTVKLLSQVPVTPTLQWAPPTAGQWTLTPKIRQPDDQVITFKPAEVIVLPAQAVTPGTMVSVSSSYHFLPFIILGLVTFAAAAAVVFRQQWKAAPAEQVHDAT